MLQVCDKQACSFAQRGGCMLPWLLNLFGFLVNKLFEAPTRLRSIKLVFLNVITCKTIQALQIMSKFVL